MYPLFTLRPSGVTMLISSPYPQMGAALTLGRVRLDSLLSTPSPDPAGLSHMVRRRGFFVEGKPNGPRRHSLYGDAIIGSTPVPSP